MKVRSRSYDGPWNPSILPCGLGSTGLESHRTIFQINLTFPIFVLHT